MRYYAIIKYVKPEGIDTKVNTLYKIIESDLSMEEIQKEMGDRVLATFEPLAYMSIAIFTEQQYKDYVFKAFDENKIEKI